MRAVVMIPVDGDLDDQPERLAAWKFVHRELEVRDYKIVTADTERGSPWRKGVALAYAREGAAIFDAELLIVHDADVLVSAEALAAAVSAVEAGAAWAMPHRLVHRLDEATTDAILGGGNFPPTEPSYARKPYTGFQGGGITVLRAETWDDCPVDHRFIGWGGEDEAWAWALGCLYGPPWRGDADLWHLWHPHPEPNARHVSTPQSHVLWRAYRAQRNRPDLMRRTLDGARFTDAETGTRSA